MSLKNYTEVFIKVLKRMSLSSILEEKSLYVNCHQIGQEFLSNKIYKIEKKGQKDEEKDILDISKDYSFVCQSLSLLFDLNIRHLNSKKDINCESPFTLK